MSKEIIKANKVSPTLFIGVGGIGSDILNRVGKLCIHDDLESVRFVALDTDVNELGKLDSGFRVQTVQTSSPRAVEDYLEDDKAAKNDWFPVNNIINGKTVSEGAGQVRAISRLALNATIKNGNINVLYTAINDLFLKDGASKTQALKVIVVSTTAGGTGSGIAMMTAMLVRHYLKKNYPESAAIIRGYFILPGVMDTVIGNESERESLRRNNYATIKEINAFMMKGSGFFESEKRLKRYKDLHVTVPTTNGGHERLDDLPFDFCFLLDKIDKNQKSMMTLDKYKSFAAQTLYEQNIGSMRNEAASKEDNVVREFTDPRKLGRCRFGGAGAAVVRYPYEEICRYLALDWTQQMLFSEIGDDTSEETKNKFVGKTWRRYDDKYDIEMQKYYRGERGDEPKIEDEYCKWLEKDISNQFGTELFNKYLKNKTQARTHNLLQTSADSYIDKFVNNIISAALETEVLPKLVSPDTWDIAETEGTDYQRRYSKISSLAKAAKGDINVDRIKALASEFVRLSVLGNDSSADDQNKAEYTIASLLSFNNQALHPNAMRYLLYKLSKYLKSNPFELDVKGLDKDIHEAVYGSVGSDGKNTTDFNVRGNIGSENNLEEMCAACDNLKNSRWQQTVQEHTEKGQPAEVRCSGYLTHYFETVQSKYNDIIISTIHQQLEDYVDNLNKQYEKFYAQFGEHAIGMNKEKEAIAENLAFRKGDFIYNLFNKQEHLEVLSKHMRNYGGNMRMESKLFAEIYNSIRENADIEARNDGFSTERPHDIFKETLIGFNYDLVVNSKADELDIDIFRAIKLEHQIKCEAEYATANKVDQAQLIQDVNDPQAIRTSIRRTIQMGRSLASSSLCRKSFDEARDINAIAYNNTIEDHGDIRVNDFVDTKGATPTVSKYELHFFCSEYNIMPTEIFQFCAPKIDDRIPSVELINDENKKTSGESFRRYQTYMDRIGPDSRMNSYITPHIDTRWNSISVMPELDLDYQEHLMKYIHKAFIYGFIFGFIDRHLVSEYDPNKYEYRYLDGKNGYKRLVVSNHTRCDALYEVLDGLYFDRAAVRSIHAQVAAIREGDENDSIDYDKTAFKRKVEKLSRVAVVGDNFPEKEKEAAETEKMSIFELIMLYYCSLPPRLRDGAEIDAMVEAVIDVIHIEMSVFESANDVNARLGKLLAAQYNLLSKNYDKMPMLLGKGVQKNANDVLATIRKKVEEHLQALDITMPKLD